MLDIKYMRICIFIVFLLFAAEYVEGTIYREFVPEQVLPIKQNWRWKKIPSLEKLGLRCLSEGRDGKLWAGTSSGLYFFDGLNWKSTEVTIDVVALHATKAGAIYYLGNNNALYRYDNEGNTLLRHQVTSSPNVPFIAELASGAVCVRSDDDVYLYKGNYRSQIASFGVNSIATGSDGNSVWVYHKQDKLALSIKINHQTGIPIGNWTDQKLERVNNTDMIVYRAPLGRLWAISLAGPPLLFRYDPTTDQWMKEKDVPRDGFTRIWGIAETKDGVLWLMSNQSLLRYDGKEWIERTQSQYPLSPFQPRLFESSDGGLWITEDQAEVFRLDRSNQVWLSYKGLSFQDEAPDGRLWFIKDQATPVVFNPHTQRWVEYTTENATIPDAEKLLILRNGTVCMVGGSPPFLSLFDGVHWKKNQLPRLDGYKTQNSVIEAADGSLLICRAGHTQSTSTEVIQVTLRGINVLNTKLHSKKIKKGHSFSFLSTADDGTVWMAGSDLRRFSEWQTTAYPPICDQLGSFSRITGFECVGNTLWISIWGRGIFTYKDGVLTNQSENGLETRLTAALAITPNNHVWALTSRGLAYFNGYRWMDKVLLDNMRFLPNGRGLKTTSDGKVWLTFKSTENDYQTVCYIPGKEPPKIHIQLNQSTIPFRGSCQIDFSPIGETLLPRPTILQYAYRINDGNWSIFSPDTSVRLENLTDGNYRIEVQAIDIDSNRTSSPETVEFTVRPPVWRQLWFILLVSTFSFVTSGLLLLLIKQRLHQIKELDDVKLQFYYNITHELRTPLTLIAGPIEKLSHTELSEQSSKLLDIVAQNTRKLSKLIDQLLGFQKIERNRESLLLAPGNLARFIDESVGSILNMAATKRISVRLINKLPAELLLFDADKIQKIIDNLMGNAIKYTPEGGEIKMVSEISLRNEQIFFRLVVEDSGIGIPEKELPRIFDRFYRVGSQELRESGFGIGLSFVKGIVNLYGGEITANSPVSEADGVAYGTRFVCLLPVNRPDAHELPDSEEIHLEPDIISTPDEFPSEIRGKTILLVEDNHELRTFLGEHLHETYSVYSAANGKDALEIAKTKPVDLVLTDYIMPYMNGFELCHALKSDIETSHLPVIILTARKAEETQLEGLRHGADAYLTKPIQLEVLDSQIKNILDSRQRLRAKYQTTNAIQPQEVTTNPADQRFLEKALNVVETHLDNFEFTVEIFAKSMHMEKSTLYRKLKALTGESSVSFIKTVRLKHAANLLKTGQHTISEVAVMCGYLDMSYFASIFKKQYGCPPSAYRSAELRQ